MKKKKRLVTLSNQQEKWLEKKTKQFGISVSELLRRLLDAIILEETQKVE